MSFKKKGNDKKYLKILLENENEIINLLNKCNIYQDEENYFL